MILVRYLLLALLVFTEPALACSSLTPEGEANQSRWEKSYLRSESDKKVRGTFTLRSSQDPASHEDILVGTIRVRDGTKYRIRVPRIINCGFPNYYITNGDSGLFYLSRTEVPEDDDLADGFIDNYDFVHFRSDRRN